MNRMDEPRTERLVPRWNTPRASPDLGPAQFRSTAMTIPHYVNEGQSDIRAIKPGWYGMESNGKLSSGPFPNQEKCLTGIARREAIFEHRPGGALTQRPGQRPWTTGLLGSRASCYGRSGLEEGEGKGSPTQNRIFGRSSLGGEQRQLSSGSFPNQGNPHRNH